MEFSGNRLDYLIQVIIQLINCLTCYLYAFVICLFIVLNTAEQIFYSYIFSHDFNPYIKVIVILIIFNQPTPSDKPVSVNHGFG
jgi:ABC-type uncharacterized transport system permease subunit